MHTILRMKKRFPELPLGKGATIALRDEGEIVGGFSSGGLLVLCGHSNDNNCRGVACLRKF
jgi:hypothetical protein